MEKILSQDEINALFSTMATDGAVVADSIPQEKVPDRSVAKYDFCRSDRISKDQIRAIHGLHINFARTFSSSLSAYLRAAVDATLISVDQVSYLEFGKQLSDPTLFYAISLQPMHGNIGMELTPSLAFPAIDMLLGGTGNSPPEKRTLTEIEMQIAEGVTKLALRDLKEAWRPIMEVNPIVESSETRPQMLQLVAPGEAVVAIGFEIKISESSGMLNLCLPSVMLKMNRAVFERQKLRGHAEADSSETGKISSLLRSARVTLTGDIHDKTLVVEDLLRMSAGDIIQLNHALDDPVQLNVGGVPKFCGRIVARRGKRAFEISHKYVY